MRPVEDVMQPLRSAVLSALALGLPWSASALEVQRSQRMLGQQQTVLAPAVNAPQTVLGVKSESGSHSASGPSTMLQSNKGPQTLLREAEVPPERLERTRVLMQTLNAQPTPQQDISIDLPADVLFDFDKATLRPDATQPLEQAAELAQSYPSAPLLVRGHTDSKGTHAYNDALSLRRAQAVALVLQSKTGRPVKSEGLGKHQPIAPNTTSDGQDNPEGRQQNRRVQILMGLPKPQ